MGLVLSLLNFSVAAAGGTFPTGFRARRSSVVPSLRRRPRWYLERQRAQRFPVRCVPAVLVRGRHRRPKEGGWVFSEACLGRGRGTGTHFFFFSFTTDVAHSSTLPGSYVNKNLYD